MIEFNLSVDFELGWGDLKRVAHDDAFYERVVRGVALSPEVVEVLARHRIPSTWGVVGGCSCNDVDELRVMAPRAFAAVQSDLDELCAHRRRPSEVLFGRRTVEMIGRQDYIDLGSHGFLHLIPAGMPTDVLRE